MSRRAIVLLLGFVAIDALSVGAFLHRGHARAPAQARLGAVESVTNEASPLVAPRAERTSARAVPSRTATPRGNDAKLARTGEGAAGVERVSLKVHVVFEDGGAPAVGVQILTWTLAWPKEEPRESMSARGPPLTDSEGFTTVKLVRGATYNLLAQVETEDDIVDGHQEVTVDSAELAPITIALRRADHGPFHLVVLDRETLAPVAGARVTELRGATRPANGLTDAHGSIALSVFSGNHSSYLEIDASGFALQRVFSSEGHSTQPSAEPVLLRRSAAVRGRVLDANGMPMSKANVFVESFDSGDLRTSVDATGSFELERLPARMKIVVKASICSACPSLRSGPIVLEPGELRALDLVAHRTLDISGHVFDPDGKAASGGWIALESEDFSDRTRVRDDGTYFAPFVPVGRCTLSASNDEDAVVRGERSLQLDVPDGLAEWTYDVRLERHRALAITGILLDAEGHAVDRGGIELGALAAGVFEGLTNADGSFSAPVDPARGTYELVALDPTGFVRTAPRTVQLGEQNLIVRLPPTRTVRGRVIDGTGRGVAEADVEVRAGAESLGVLRCETDGRFEAHVATDQPLTLLAGDELRRSKTIRLEAGSGAQTVEFVLEASGRVRFVAARPAAGASYRIERDGALLALGSLQPEDDTDVDVPAGLVRAIVRASDGREESHDVEVHAGATALVPVLSRP